MTDRRSALYDAYALAEGVVSNIGPAQLADPTPCPAYDVAALVDHLVGAAWRTAALGRGEQTAGDGFPHVELADAPGELQRAAQAARGAWADDGRLTATVAVPWGERYDGATLVDMYLAELATHAWDLARATGQRIEGDDLPADALAAARGVIRPEYRNAAGEGTPFGAEVETPEGATAWEALAAFMGRQPR